MVIGAGYNNNNTFQGVFDENENDNDDDGGNDGDDDEDDEDDGALLSCPHSHSFFCQLTFT